MLDDKELRDLYAAGSADILATDQSHLEDGDWERFSCGEMSAEERRQAVDHITRCSECARIFRALSLLERETEKSNQDLPRSRTSFGWLAFAAAAALVLFIAIPSNGPKDASDSAPSEPALRGGPEARRPRPVAPIGRVSAPPSVLTWQGIGETASYRVEVLSGDGEPLWESPVVHGTSVELPSGVVNSPGRYFWRVLGRPESAVVRPTPSELVVFEVPAD